MGLGEGAFAAYVDGRGIEAPASALSEAGSSRPGRDAGRWALGQRALERISYPWEQLLDGWRIEFLPGRRGLLGGTWTYERRIEIYVRPHHGIDELAFTIGHELGHAVDVGLLGPRDRSAWRRQRGIGRSTPWWVGTGETDFSSGAGDWAEAFAVWQVGGRSASRLGGQPTPEDLALVRDLAWAA